MVIEDLTKVKGIGQKTLDKNKKDILLTDMPTSTSEPAAIVVDPKVVVEPSKVNKAK